MQIIQAYLVKDPSQEEKRKLQYVTATYSSISEGWFITQEQKDKMDTCVLEVITPAQTTTSNQPISEATPAVEAQTCTYNPNTSLQECTSVPTLSSGIFIDDLGSEWKIHGKTFNRREAIKKFSAKWTPKDKSWRISKEKASMDELTKVLA